jgi:hypothetical protein
MLTSSLLAIVLAQSTPAPSPAGAPARAPAAPMAFAFSDATGKRLLALADDPASIADPRAFGAAVCADGTIAKVAYVRLQRAAPGGNGRQTAANFDRETGHLYAVVSSRPVPKGVACLLTGAAFVSGARAAPLAVRGAWEDGPFVPADSCPRDLLEPLELARKARATACLPLGPSGKDRGAAVAFVEGVEVPTLVLVYAGPAGVFTHEVRAAGERNDVTCWRIDDACTLDPRTYRLVALHAGGTTRLIVLWAGPEGEQAQLAELRDGKIVGVLEAYRYWSPE